MGNSSSSSRTKRKDVQKPQTSLPTSNNQQNSSPQLDLINNQEYVHIETKETIKLQSNNTVEADDDENINYDHKIFGDIFSRRKDWIDKSKSGIYDNIDIFFVQCEILRNCLSLIEKYKKNLTNYDFLVLKKGVMLFYHEKWDAVLTARVCEFDIDFPKKIFYMYFNLFNDTGIQNYLKDSPIADGLKITYRLFISRIFDSMLRALMNVHLSLDDPQRPRNFITLLSSMFNYIKIDLESSDLTKDPEFTDPSITRYWILLLMCIYSNQTNMIPDLIEAGFSEIMVNGLKRICQIEGIDQGLQKSIITILYNISRHDDGAKQLNSLNTIDVIKQCQNSKNNADTSLDYTCSMTLVLLSTPEQIDDDSKSMNNALDTLLQLIYDISLTGVYRSSSFHLVEPLVALTKLLNNDRLLIYMIKDSNVYLESSSVIEFFINLLIDYPSKTSESDRRKHVTCTALVNILWRSSFLDEYKEQLKNSKKEFQELIHRLANNTEETRSSNQYIPSYIENIQEAAKGLLFNISEFIDVNLQATQDRNQSSTHFETTAEQWNNDDISQWFEQNKVIRELQDLCQVNNGYELLNYAKNFLDTEKLRYEMYCEEFSRHDGITFGERPLLLHEFTKLSNALRKLYELNKSSSTRT